MKKKHQNIFYYLCDNNAMDNFALNKVFVQGFFSPHRRSRRIICDNDAKKAYIRYFLSHDIFLNMTSERASKRADKRARVSMKIH